MRSSFVIRTVMMALALSSAVGTAEDAPRTDALKVHGIFASNMVLQRGKPIKVWGWAKPGQAVSVQLGGEKAEATAAAEKGRWEVTFPAREANVVPQTLLVSAGAEKVAMTNVVIGDVWVMTGQSNMAFPLGKIQEADVESAQANLPLLRLFSIDPNEQSEPQEDIPSEKISTQGWAVSDPVTSREFSAIGYVFGARIQRSLGIPVGLIKSARGGASIEAIVPRQMFDKHPLAKRYAESVKKRMAEFNMETTSLQVWSNQLARAKGKKLPEDKWPKKPVNGDNLTSWNIPGRSASDMGSIHNGMFGIFKGYNIKGVLFHQGYNNAMTSNCRPKRYRVLMKLMVEGWREDFNDPELPVGVIEFCAGGDPQTGENFEAESHAGGPFIREAQRLGLADVGDPVNTAFLPGYDIQVPGLHPGKKREHGERAARWALKSVYKIKGMEWDSAKLVSAEPKGDVMVLKFDKGVMPDNWSPIPEGFSIAGENGKFYKAYARFPLKPDAKSASNARAFDTTTIRVWSPLVKAPKGVRYAWANSPMGNLKVGGRPWLPLQSFRTDTFDWPESEDPEVQPIDRAKGNEMKAEAEARLEERRTKEAEMGRTILQKLKEMEAPGEGNSK
jgi:sialate O-acetylesterase